MIEELSKKKDHLEQFIAEVLHQTYSIIKEDFQDLNEEEIMYDQLLEIIEVIKVKIHKKDQEIAELEHKASRPPVKTASEQPQENGKQFLELHYQIENNTESINVLEYLLQKLLSKEHQFQEEDGNEIMSLMDSMKNFNDEMRKLFEQLKNQRGQSGLQEVS